MKVKGKNRSGRIWKAVREWLCLLVGLACIGAFRYWYAAPTTANEVFKMAMVTSDQFEPEVVHNGYRTYLYLLHGVLFLLGNKIKAGVFLQIVLEAAAISFCYYAMRRFSNIPAALLFVFYWGISPYMLAEATRFSPFWLFIASFGAGLWCIFRIADSCLEEPWRWRRTSFLIQCVITGVVIGFCGYLDMAGNVLWVFFVCAVGLKGEEKRLIKIYVGGLGAALLCHGILYFAGSDGLGDMAMTLYEQLELFVPKGAANPFRIRQTGMAWDIPVLAVLAGTGILGFFFRGEKKTRGMWLVAAVVLLAMQCFGMVSDQPVNTFALLYMFCAVLAGYSVGDMIRVKEKKRDTENEDRTGEQSGQSEQDDWEETAQDGQDRKEKTAQTEQQDGKEKAPQSGQDGKEKASQSGQDGEEETEINYIENPLPLPKKHVKKVLDYDYPVADDDDFDIQ